MKILKRIGLGLLLLIGVFLLLGFYYLGSEPVPEETDFTIDLPALRALAGTESATDQLPIEIRYEIIASGELPRGLIMAGEGFEPTAMPRPVFQVVYADGHTILIDSAYDRTLHEAGAPSESFDDAAWENLVVAMEAAEQIVVTHEHSDHLGGVLKHPRPERLIRSLRLTEEQLSTRGDIFAVLPESIRSKLTPVQYADMLAIAPGVVLKKARGHTPGSQMVFVALANGNELLFVGDVVWNFDAVTQLKYRPRLITDLFLGEDRAAVLAQIRALRIRADAGDVPIVVSHDRRTFTHPGLRTGFVTTRMTPPS